MSELPMSAEERLAALERKVAMMWNGGGDLLGTEGYFQVGTSNNRGAVRLDGQALQINAGSGNAVGGLWFVPELVPDPNDADVAKVYILGSAKSTGAASLTITAVDPDPPNADVAAVDIEMGATGSNDYARYILRARTGGSLAGGGDWGEVWLNHVWQQDAATLQLYQTLLRLCPSQDTGYPFTSDPANAIEGDIWYNTTDNQFKFYEGSTIKTLGGGGVPTPPLVGTASRYCVGDILSVYNSTAPASATYPASNRAILIPMVVPADCTVVKLWVHNGSTATSGNIDLAIYDESYARTISIGSTAQAGAGEVQEFNITDTALTAGRYYLAVAMDNTTGTIQRWNLDSRLMETAGVSYMESAFPLPSTFVPVASGGTASYLPLIGMSLRTLVT